MWQGFTTCGASPYRHKALRRKGLGLILVKFFEHFHVFFYCFVNLNILPVAHFSDDFTNCCETTFVCSNSLQCVITCLVYQPLDMFLEWIFFKEWTRIDIWARYSSSFWYRSCTGHIRMWGLRYGTLMEIRLGSLATGVCPGPIITRGTLYPPY